MKLIDAHALCIHTLLVQLRLSRRNRCLCRTLGFRGSREGLQPDETRIDGSGCLEYRWWWRRRDLTLLLPYYVGRCGGGDDVSKEMSTEATWPADCIDYERGWHDVRRRDSSGGREPLRI